MLRGKLSRFHLLTVLVLATCVVAPWPVVAGVVITYVVLVAAGVTYPQMEFFLPVVCRIRTRQRVVALTFDDGPDPQVTPSLLTLLKELGVRTTFFCIGERLEAQPELARRIVADGHLICNHSYRHLRGTNLLRTSRLREEIERGQAVVNSVTNQQTNFFRPPMGLTNSRLARVAAALDLKVVGWTAGGKDQKAQTAEEVVKRARRGIRPGAIILLHDGGATSSVLLPAVKTLVEDLRREGYELWRLDELITGVR